MARISTSDRDRGAARIIQLTDVFSRKPIVTIGIQGAKASATHDDSVETMVEIMLKNEFGLDNCPERSVIRHVMTAHQAQIQAAGRVLFRKVLAGTLTTEQALGQMGITIVNLMRARIESNIAPPLVSREGIALKDTGRLEDSFSFKTHPTGKARR